MPEVLPIPDDLRERLTEPDRRRLEHLERNLRIHRAFRRLHEQGEMSKQAAYRAIAREEAVSVSTVREVVRGNR